MGTFFHYDLNEIVEAEHALRKVAKMLSFSAMAYRVKDVEERTVGRTGYGMEVALKCLFLQFMYDLSDRQLEERIRDSLAMRWFLGFKVGDRTPDHSFFGRVRTELGASRIHKLLALMNKKAKENGTMKSLDLLRNPQFKAPSYKEQQ